MTDFAVKFALSAMDNLLPCKNQRLRKRMARQYLPYAVHIYGGRDDLAGLLLNRNYKPLGWPDEISRVHYADVDFSSFVLGLDYEVPFITREDGQSFHYFYGAAYGDPPWASAEAARSYRLGFESFIRSYWTGWTE